MKVWNKETRNEDGMFYRDHDWSVERTTSWLHGDEETAPHPRASNFTDVEPPIGEKCDWDEATGTWVIDTTYTAEEATERRLKDIVAEMPVNEIALTMLDQFLELRTAGKLTPTTRMAGLLDKWETIKEKYANN